MEVKCIGVQDMDFTTENGDRLVGANFFFSYPMEGVAGEVAEKKFVRQEQLPMFPLEAGKRYIVSFSPKGKLISIVNAPTKA